MVRFFSLYIYAEEGIRTLAPTKGQGPQPCAFDQTLPPPRHYLSASENSFNSSVKRSAALAKISDADNCPQDSMLNMNDVGSFSIFTISSLTPSQASYKLCCSINLPHSIVVAAWSFSETAKDRIEKAKGKAITITELLKNKPH